MTNETFEKNEPKVMRIRGWLMIAIVIFVVVVLGSTFIGLITNSHTPKHENTSTGGMPKVAQDSDIQWVKSGAEQTQLQAPPTSKVSNSAIKKANNNGNNPASVSTSAYPAPANSDDMQKIMSAPISSNQITNNVDATNISTNNSLTSTSLPSQGNSSQTQDDQNLQGEKKAFLQMNDRPNLDDYLSSSVQKPLSQYELQAGSIIPGILVTGINSDLPGQITGQVRSNVYDSISGNHLLIPQGSKVVGLYDSQVAYGQERVLVVWNRIIFPNGQSIDLQGMSGVDLSGYSGFNDLVNNHYGKIFGSVILMSFLSAGAQLSQPQNNNSSFITTAPTVGQTLAASVGTNIANTGTMITQKNINIQPTLEIRPGYEFNIMVKKDMVFPNAYAN